LGIIIKKDNLTNKVGRLNKKMGFYLEGVSDCEELVGSNTNLLHPFNPPKPSYKPN
jgi:hypothetical protein